MKVRYLLLLMALLAGASVVQAKEQPWPEVTQTAKPWIRWWWPGSAVEPGQLSAQLRAFADAGIGGVEITPIYGARGAEARDIEYLSPRWVAMLDHVTREARKLGLGVDMATGTGWPFGGPGVTPADGSSSLQLVDGRLTGKPTDMKVKRAAPGGEGLVLDPYSVDALNRYLERFSKALTPLQRGAVRSQFHDSFEYYHASWSPGLPAKFLQMHGYDIQKYAAELAGEKPLDADTLGRIKGDYRRTLAAMHLAYVEAWVRWSHERGFIARNQAHGSPGRLLDLYGASDIPETESFGASLIPSLRLDPAQVSEDPDPPINLIGRFASSAAHVMGRPLVSSETLTWLRENFQESPAAAKPQLDRLFIAGINHIFYHGSTYSPSDAAWPGWFFYAATQLNPSNPLWQDFSAMHAYVARVQSVLQAGQPDNDILLYWPEADFADEAEGLMRQQGMHDNAWLVKSPAGLLALDLLKAGYSFDFISDAQLRQVRVRDDMLVTQGGGRYRVIVVPKTRRMPIETVQVLDRLGISGAQLMYVSLPEDVAGYGRLAAKREEFAQWKAAERTRKLVAGDLVASAAGLSSARREELATLGCWVTRRARVDGFDYFIASYTGPCATGWVNLATPAAYALLLDPLDGTSGRAALRSGRNGRAQVFLQIEPGQSLILRTYAKAPRQPMADWRYLDSSTGYEPTTFSGVEFLRGGPELPPRLDHGSPGSWTADVNSKAMTRFSGTARYRLEFDRPPVKADEWWLDLGEVRESARVVLNGNPVGTAWSRPFRLRLGTELKPRGNVLEIEVTNSPANRIRDLDQRKVDWKVMKEINLVNLRYRPFDAAGWEPTPSGLLGPVQIRAMTLVSPP